MEVDTRPPSGAPRSTPGARSAGAQAISRELGALAWLPRGAGPDPAG
ncbi:MAG TPA: hypothetical protein VER97_15250 [Geodermatophilus sp.]|nr:hypothetical protein [Geodermatophilus sp.]